MRTRVDLDILFTIEFLDVCSVMTMVIKGGKNIHLARITNKVFEIIWYSSPWREYEFFYFPDNLVETENEIIGEDKEKNTELVAPKTSLFMYIANKHE